jgi:hypothetical protein
MPTITQLVAIFGGWTALIACIVYWLSKRVVEKFNIHWKETSDKNIARLQSELDKNNSTLNSLITLTASNYHQAQQRRIQAIEVLWKNLLLYKEIIPIGGYTVYGILTDKELETYFTRQTDNGYFLHDRNSITNLLEPSYLPEYFNRTAIIDTERPFIGEKIWSNYKILQGFIGRIVFLLKVAAEKKKTDHWHNDEGLKQILGSYLSVEEMKYVYSRRVSSLQITIELLEGKLLTETNKVLSGETFSENALERVKKFEIALVKRS